MRTTKKHTKSLLIALLTLATLGVMNPTEMKAQFDGGNGTDTLPYQIKTTANWNHFVNYIATNNGSEGIYFELTANIGTSNSPVTQMATSIFKGRFDGNNYSIFVNINSSDQYVGLFSQTGGNSDTIKNLTVAGTVVSTSDANPSYVGGIIGYATGKINVTDCINEANVSYSTTNGKIIAGGIIGAAHNTSTESKIKMCINTGKITANYCAGGIVGEYLGMTGGTLDSIIQCANAGRIELLTNNIYPAQGNPTLGGIAGTIAHSSEISECLNIGTIMLYSKNKYCFVGGLVGLLNDTSKMEWCINSGLVTGHNECAFDSSYFGGLIGGFLNIGLNWYTVTIIKNSMNTGQMKPPLGTWMCGPLSCNSIFQNQNFMNCYYVREICTDLYNTPINDPFAKTTNEMLTPGLSMGINKFIQSSTTTYQKIASLTISQTPNTKVVLLADSISKVASIPVFFAPNHLSPWQVYSNFTFTSATAGVNWRSITGRITMNNSTGYATVVYNAEDTLEAGINNYKYKKQIVVNYSYPHGCGAPPPKFGDGNTAKESSEESLVFLFPNRPFIISEVTPMPAEDFAFFTIISKEQDVFSVNIYDLRGFMVLSDVVNKKTIYPNKLEEVGIDCSKLSPGQYIVMVSIGKFKVPRPLIKQ